MKLEDLGKKVINKNTGEITIIKSYCNGTCIHLANGLSFAEGSPFDKEWIRSEKPKETLSDLIEHGKCPVCDCFHRDEYDWLKTCDVREFIKKIKSEIFDLDFMTEEMFYQIETIIDEEAGEELK